MSFWKKGIEQFGGKDGDPLLQLDLDDLYTAGYFSTMFDIGGAGHSRIILAKDKEAFLDEQAKKFRASMEEHLEVYHYLTEEAEDAE